MEWRQLVTARPRLCGQTLLSANSRRRARVGYFCLASVSVIVGAMYSLLKQSFFRLSNFKYCQPPEFPMREIIDAKALGGGRKGGLAPSRCGGTEIVIM